MFIIVSTKNKLGMKLLIWGGGQEGKNTEGKGEEGKSQLVLPYNVLLR